MAITPWWKYPIIDLFGQYPDPEGAFPKPDINIEAPAGTLFTAPLPGTVSGIDYQSSFGDVITVNLDNPINGAATHYAFLHLSKIAPVQIGEHVTAGEVLGIGGGGQSKSGSSPGFALTASSSYGYGSGWANNVKGTWINPQLDPTNLFNSIAGGNVISGISGGNNPVSNALGIQLPTVNQWTQAGFVIVGAIIVIIALILMLKGS
jgi:hypothetical protein